MNLLYKELRLTLHPTNLIFLCFFLMVFIPNYPYYIAPFWTILGVQFLCVNAREFHDVEYALTLPVRKRDLVKARMGLICALELLQLLLCIPAFLLKDRFIPLDNVLGMEANFAFIGFSLIMLGAFNFVFFTRYYRNVRKVGGPFLLGIVVFWVLMLLFEALTYFLPLFQDKLDTRGTAFLPEKLIVLAIGAVVYALLTVLAYRKAAKSFEALDL